MKKLFTLLMAIFICHSLFASGSSSGNWRWRNDDGNDANATWVASENTPITLTNKTSQYRLRMSLYTNSDGGTGTFKLQYTSSTNLETPPALNSSNTANNNASTDEQNPGTIPWADVTTNGSGAFTMASSSFVSNGLNIAEKTSDVGGEVRRDDGSNRFTTNQTTAGDPYSLGKVYTTTNGNTTSSNVPDDTKNELEFCIKPGSSLSSSTVYYFRIVGTDNLNRTQGPGGHLSTNTSMSAYAGGAYPYLTTSASILPVTITDFNVVVDANGNQQITWATATEVNSANYIIESSIDGINFSPLATVASKNSLTGASYTYTYTKGLPQGVNYLRLKAVDKDASAMYSSIKAINVTSGTSKITIAPNPVANTLNIAGLQSGSTVQLYNINAQKVLTAITTGASVQQINVSNLSHGAYYVQIINAGKVIANQLIIKQ